MVCIGIYVICDNKYLIANGKLIIFGCVELIIYI